MQEIGKGKTHNCTKTNAKKNVSKLVDKLEEKQQMHLVNSVLKKKIDDLNDTKTKNV